MATSGTECVITVLDFSGVDIGSKGISSDLGRGILGEPSLDLLPRLKEKAQLLDSSKNLESIVLASLL